MNSKPTDHPLGRRRPVPWPAVVLAIGILLASASTSRAALVLDISSTSMQPSGSAIISVYTSAFDINTPDEVGSFSLVLGIDRAQDTSLLEFTSASGDEDFSGRADYIFSGQSTAPTLIGNLAVAPQRIGRSDFVDFDVLVSVSNRVLLGQFTIRADPFALPSPGDEFTITIDQSDTGTFFYDNAFTPVPIHSVSGGRIQISAVPEPSSLLGLSGLMGGWVLARRRRRASR